MNAGMYDEEGKPIGLFVTQGKVGKRLNLRSGTGWSWLTGASFEASPR